MLSQTGGAGALYELVRAVRDSGRGRQTGGDGRIGSATGSAAAAGAAGGTTRYIGMVDEQRRGVDDVVGSRCKGAML